MSVFIDTSAFLAVLDADDLNHARASASWRSLLASTERLLTSNYVLVETFALLQRRLGVKAVTAFQRDVLAVVDVVWVDAATHDAAVAAVISASRRHLSLVDCVSFQVMSAHGLQRCFAFDRHFVEQGFVQV